MSPALIEHLWLLLTVLCFTGDAALIIAAVHYTRVHDAHDKKGVDDQRD